MGDNGKYVGERGTITSSSLEEGMLAVRREAVCPVCGKQFLVPTKNVYKFGRKKKGPDVCSYKCVLESITKQEAPDRCRNCVFLNEGNVCAVTAARKYRNNVCSYFVERT